MRIFGGKMRFLNIFWETLIDAAPFLILGLFIAGIIKAFLKDELIKKHLGEANTKSVFKSAFFGIPLPLCSCGVVPTAISLRKQGASKGATTSFLISTPESGVDSIAISYAMLDPILTIMRPVAGFIIAIFSGILENFFPAEKPKEEIHVHSCCSNGHSSTPKISNEKTFFEKIKYGMNYSFVELMNDLSFTLFIGLILAALISWLIPESFFAEYLSNSMFSMLVMLIIGIPMYICATASTPIAAALILKGLSPGAAIVFLIAGPATNLASLTVLRKSLGNSTVLRYLLTIIIFSFIFGGITEYIYSFFELSTEMNYSPHEHGTRGNIFYDIIAGGFLIYLFWGIWNEKIKNS
jgi:uncharacterized membrane protein YraQ (UPF0718 family)